MNANELRIGNLVYKSLKSGQGRTVINPIGCQDIVRIFEDIGSFNYAPIPLTEDILLKCGFEIRKYGLSKDYYIGINEITKDWLFYIVWLNDFEYPFYMNGRHQVKCLHQLQNLYFALTQKELTIKL